MPGIGKHNPTSTLFGTCKMRPLATKGNKKTDKLGELGNKTSGQRTRLQLETMAQEGGLSTIRHRHTCAETMGDKGRQDPRKGGHTIQQCLGRIRESLSEKLPHRKHKQSLNGKPHNRIKIDAMCIGILPKLVGQYVALQHDQAKLIICICSGKDL